VSDGERDTRLGPSSDLITRGQFTRLSYVRLIDFCIAQLIDCCIAQLLYYSGVRVVIKKKKKFTQGLYKVPVPGTKRIPDAERRGNHMKGVKDFYLKSKAKIWPCLICAIFAPDKRSPFLTNEAPRRYPYTGLPQTSSSRDSLRKTSTRAV